jgi:rhomboid-like protein
MSTFRSSPFANIPPVVKNLLIINVIFFIATNIFSRGDELPLVGHLAVFYFDSPFFRVWQVVTYMFMHGGLMHIFFNMFALFTFGSAIEGELGSKRFLNYYLITGLGALALQMIVQAIELYMGFGSITLNPDTLNSTIQSQHQLQLYDDIYRTPMLGASGAIFGILIAFGMLFPNVELFLMFIPVPVKAKYIIPLYIVAEMVFGVAKIQGDSVAHFAHLGGALFGFILIKLWGINRPRKFYE